MDKTLIENDLHNERDRAKEYLDIAGVIRLVLNTDGKVTLINKCGAEDIITRTPVPAHIELICVLDSADPSIIGDYGQVVQIFNNLVLNAVEAMPEAGCLSIRTSEVADPDPSHRHWVEVAIADTGTGIPEENLNKIFEPLFSTKTKGIGLGLTLVKTLIDGHEGCLSVYSIVGQGSEFTVRLPMWLENGYFLSVDSSQGE